MTKLDAINKKIEDTKASLEKLEFEAITLRLELMEKVTLKMTSPDNFELSFNGRKIIAIRKTGLRVRYAVKEGNKTILPSYNGNMFQLRVDIASGKL